MGGFAHEVGRAVAHAHLQGCFSAMTGGDYATTFATSVVSSGVGSALAPLMKDALFAYIVFDATIGGVTSELMGGDFWAGFTTSLMIVGLNHTLHDLLQNAIVEDYQKTDQANTEATIRFMEKNKLEAPKGISDEDYVRLLKKQLVFSIPKKTQSINGEITYKSRVDAYKVSANARGLELPSLNDISVKDAVDFAIDVVDAIDNKSLKYFFELSPTSALFDVWTNAQPFSKNSVPVSTYDKINTYIDLQLRNLE